MSAAVTSYGPSGYRCADCGGQVWLLSRPGRTCSFRGRHLPIPAAFAIPTCAECDAEWIDEELAGAIDRACAQEGGAA